MLVQLHAGCVTLRMCLHLSEPQVCHLEIWETEKDSEAWSAAVYGVAKSQT